MKTSDVLRKAGDVLRERGWCQGRRERDGRFCLVGAVEMSRAGVTAPVNSAASSEAYRDPALSVVSLVTAGRYRGADAFNDSAVRTVDEVLIAMDAAYVLALQEEGIEPEDVLA